MAKDPSAWIVGDHGPLEQHADNIWSVEAKLKGMGLKRRMVVVRRNGDLLIHNAIALRDSDMERLEDLGTVRWIVVPNHWHRMDCARYKRRYPEVTVVCPGGSRRKVAKVVAVDQNYADFEDDEVLGLSHLDGMKGLEGVVRVRSADGTTLVFNDVIFNVPRAEGGFLLRLMGSSGGPKVTRIMRMFGIKDRKALRANLEALHAEHAPVRVVPGHGHILTEPDGLLQIASGL